MYILMKYRKPQFLQNNSSSVKSNYFQETVVSTGLKNRFKQGSNIRNKVIESLEGILCYSPKLKGKYIVQRSNS